MGDAPRNRASQTIQITNEDETLTAEVILRDGKKYLQVFGIQAIESLRGFDPQADTWFYIGTEEDSQGIGDVGDVITLIIAAGDDPITYPAINIPYTLTAADVAGTEDDLALTLANFYNTQSPFNQLWRAQRIQGNGVVYITARRPGGQYERPNTDDFNVTATGNTVVTRAFDRIIRQNKITGLARDPIDPRQGQLGIQGSVVETAGDVTSRFQQVFPNLNVNANPGNPANFTVLADPTEVRFISSVTISGRDNGIQFSNFLGQNNALTNGILVFFKSNDIEATREPIRTTDDFLDLHAEDPDNFVVFFASGEDKFTAKLEFSPPLEIRPQGEFAIDDFLTIRVRDNLTSINQLRAIVSGFNREF